MIMEEKSCRRSENVYEDILMWLLLNKKLVNVVWKCVKKAIEDTDEESKIQDF